MDAQANPDNTSPSVPATPPPSPTDHVTGVGPQLPKAAPASQAQDTQLGGASVGAADPANADPTRVDPTRVDPTMSNPPSFNPLANGPQPPALEPRLAAVANIADPHLRQHVEANVRLQTQRQIAAFTDAQRQAKAQAKQVIDQGGDLSTIPAKLMLRIDTPGRLALRDYVMAHGNPATDPATYYGLKNQALDDPVSFQAVDIANHMARLKPSDYADLQQLQTSLKNNQPPADLPLQQAYKANTDRMLRQLKLPADASGDPQSVAEALQLRQAVDLGLAAHQAVYGRKATPAEQQQILDQAVIDRYVHQRHDETDAAIVVPPQHRDAIIHQFRAQGVQPTAAQIARAYRRLQESR